MAPEQRREHLLDATLRVIASRGVGKVSIDSVAKEADVTRPVVYKHFDDTNALLRASLAREERRANEQFLAALPPEPSSMPIEDLIGRLTGNLLRTFEDSPELWRAALVLADSTTPEFRKRLEYGRQVAADQLTALLTDRVGHGELSSDADVEVLAHFLLSMIVESGRLLLSSPEKFTRARLAGSASRAIGTMLGAVDASL
ncbi:putative TetR family transcriptional regulator [Gordonia effusa NBRC 100432]|uniref:Putative TetR family transcriptional regulator n=2 Tax=Gordonia effusa TaxID=263908 RepID=H0QVY3_9ACTN|nr:putative TetR family transcriptional regulator [Gordonia effusa NBRC 100432]